MPFVLSCIKVEANLPYGFLSVDFTFSFSSSCTAVFERVSLHTHSFSFSIPTILSTQHISLKLRSNRHHLLFLLCLCPRQIPCPLDLRDLASSEFCFCLVLVLEQACIPVPGREYACVFFQLKCVFTNDLKVAVFIAFSPALWGFYSIEKNEESVWGLCLPYGWHFCSMGPYQETPFLRTFPVLFVSIWGLRRSS